jgi:flavin-binding protein dodecin
VVLATDPDARAHGLDSGPLGPIECWAYPASCDALAIGAIVAEHTYRVVEVVGSSADSVEDAIRGAVSRVAAPTRNLDWFEVTEIRGQLADGAVAHFQVGLKVGFRIEDV